MCQSDFCVFLDRSPGKAINIIVSFADIAKRRILSSRIFIPSFSFNHNNESGECVQNIFQSASIVNVHKIVGSRILAWNDGADFGYFI
jgi:hypothetical protein